MLRRNHLNVRNAGKHFLAKLEHKESVVSVKKILR